MPSPTSAAELETRYHALRAHFDSGATRTYKARRKALRALRDAIHAHEEELLAAMHADMRKPRFEAYMSDVGLVYKEIDLLLRHLKAWMRPVQLPTPLAVQVARTTLYPEPLGVVLVIAPWNYPALLLLMPLASAIAAGNCVLVKPSHEALHTAEVVEQIINRAFAPGHVAVAQGPGSSIGPQLIERFRFDHLFFTGSAPVGRKVMAMAAAHLTPVTLELGGKSPAIVDARVNIDKAAKRIAWSKYFNAGQTCIATDHALVHRSVMDPFLDRFSHHTLAFFGEDPRRSPDFARIINDRRFATVKSYLEQGRILLGGTHDATDRYIPPTVLLDVPLDAPVMQEEVFGPVLPVITWTDREEVLAIVQRNPQPLATYLFSDDTVTQRFFRERIAFGSGCINHCFLQFGVPDLPFGGVGRSGMGHSHGRRTFDLFSHQKGIVQASTLIDPGIQYPPYTAFKERVLRWVL
jgi:aldehyde dehydrogenase (NAD+)